MKSTFSPNDKKTIRMKRKTADIAFLYSRSNNFYSLLFYIYLQLHFIQLHYGSLGGPQNRRDPRRRGWDAFVSVWRVRST